MKNSVNIGRLKAIPLALLLSFLFQAGAAVWWVSAKARDNHFLEQRVGDMERILARENERSTQINERLARIEERIRGQTILLNRIDKQISLTR